MLSIKNKIWLLDEVVSTAFGSWHIYLAGHDKFSDWPEECRSQSAYRGYTTLRSLLCHSLMVACYALVDSSNKAYSLHHAVKDPDLIVTPMAVNKCENCLRLRSKIATYRNNVTAHVNNRRTQSEWAQFANIKNGEIDAFLLSARAVVEELGKVNLGTEFVPSSRMPFQRDFNEFCRVIIDNKS
ncbi:MAG: hypothetical protein COB78_10080 [Hyphomicrobiales bacterium]|nr:MAG: hypothetical protein COB78_10080 [Hyphomicrobiales bacterium]